MIDAHRIHVLPARSLACTGGIRHVNDRVIGSSRHRLGAPGRENTILRVAFQMAENSRITSFAAGSSSPVGQ
jgi:hypothetical protein